MTAAPLLVAACAAGAVWLLVPAGGPLRPPAVVAARDPRRVPLATSLAVAVTAGVLGTVLDGARLALGLVLLLAAAGCWQLVRRARAAAHARRNADRVVEACETLAAELRAGQPHHVALEQCASAWPALRPVAVTADLGGDVPQTLRMLAGSVPGAGRLTDVAAAWQVSTASGATMAAAVGRTAESLRRRRRIEHVVAGELASAQATARLVAVLPLVVLGTGAGLGGEPWQFLLGTGPGVACLAVGLALVMLGLWWIQRIADTVMRT